MLLILGAGNKPHVGKNTVNHDIIKHRPEIDVAWDLNTFPWPWEDDTFDAVQAWAVLEHLHADRLQIFNELWRITKPNGLAVVKLPAWDSEHAHDDITHYWYATLHCLDQLDPTTERGRDYGFYTPRKWKIERVKYSNTGHSSIYWRLRKVTE